MIQTLQQEQIVASHQIREQTNVQQEKAMTQSLRKSLL